MQLGRRWETYHATVEPFGRERGWRYVYKRSPRDWVFTTREAFLDGLADAKISVCVPRSVTHPKGTGAIETMTWRYLQSMAPRCLVLGRMPTEMRDLWDYNPLVEIDLFHSREQLQEVLERYESYAPLIKRNYNYVLQRHQWTHRLDALWRGVQEYKDGHE